MAGEKPESSREIKGTVKFASNVLRGHQALEIKLAV